MLLAWSGCSADQIVHALGLEVSDLFPPKSSSAATLKKCRLISAGQALNLLHDETHLVAVCAADMGRGEALDAKTRERLLLAGARIVVMKTEVDA